MGRTLNSILKQKMTESGRTATTLSKLTELDPIRLDHLLNDRIKRMEISEYFKICKVLNLNPTKTLEEYESIK